LVKNRNFHIRGIRQSISNGNVWEILGKMIQKFRWNFRFLTIFEPNFHFDRNFNFWPKFRFSTRISIFDQILIFDQNFDVRSKFRFSIKISIFDKNFDFRSKFRFSTNIFGSPWQYKNNPNWYAEESGKYVKTRSSPFNFSWPFSSSAFDTITKVQSLSSRILQKIKSTIFHKKKSKKIYEPQICTRFLCRESV